MTGEKLSWADLPLWLKVGGPLVVVLAGVSMYLTGKAYGEARRNSKGLGACSQRRKRRRKRHHK